MNYIVYLDEFGHIGPFIDRADPLHNDSPVFGLAGYLLPIEQVRSFGTWFFQRKCELLAFEIDRAQTHPAVWEKKGSSLFTVRNVTKYHQLRRTTFRLLAEIKKRGGAVFYVGRTKPQTPERHDANRLYRSTLREALKRLDQYCLDDVEEKAQMMIALDEHDQRAALLTQSSIAMYGPENRKSLIEPPFQIESHRYQTMQAADWIAGLVGRLGALQVRPKMYPDYSIFDRYFAARLKDVCIRSGIRV